MVDRGPTLVDAALGAGCVRAARRGVNRRVVVPAEVLAEAPVAGAFVDPMPR